MPKPILSTARSALSDADMNISVDVCARLADLLQRHNAELQRHLDQRIDEFFLQQEGLVKSVVQSLPQHYFGTPNASASPNGSTPLAHVLGTTLVSSEDTFQPPDPNDEKPVANLANKDGNLMAKKEFPYPASEGEDKTETKDARVHWKRKVQELKKDAKHFRSLRRNESAIKIEESLAQKVLRNHIYENAVLTAILMNAAFIGLTTQYAAKTGRNLDWQPIVEIVFNLVFSSELILRLVAEGKDFFYKSADSSWNYFDSIVVVFGLVELCLAAAGDEDKDWMSQISVLRAIRVVRVIRVLRIIRVLKFFRDLRIMIQSLVCSVKSLAWVALVLGMLFYIFAISMTQGCIDYFDSKGGWFNLSEEERQAENLLRQQFGTLDASMLTLFEAMSGGISWGEPLDSLSALPVTYSLIFLAFISLSIYAVTNIVTGVFVENALQSGQQDRESLIQEEVRAKESYAEQIYHFFHELDADSSGFVGLSELEKAVQEEVMVAYFNAMELDITDVLSLFVLLDKDRTGFIDVEEFLVGCMRLKGGARTVDLAKLLYESEWVVSQVDILQMLVEEISKRLIGPAKTESLIQQSMKRHHVGQLPHHGHAEQINQS